MKLHRLAVTVTVGQSGAAAHGAQGPAEHAVQEPAPIIRARALELVDDRNKVRARLNVEEDGEVVFRLMDQKGTIRVKLGAGEDGSGFLLNNQKTEPGIHMLAKPEGSTIRLANPGGKELILQP